MKGKEIIDFIMRAEIPDTETVRANCILQGAPEARRRKCPVFRAVASLVAIAVVALALFLGTYFINPHSGNAFSLTAYALEEKTDGTVVYHEFSDISIQTDGQNGQIRAWGGYDGRGVYRQGIRILLEINGENIQEIQFSTDENVTFALADFKIENGEIIYDRAFYDDDGVFLGGQVIVPVKRLGSNFTLATDELADGLTDEFTYGLLLQKKAEGPEAPFPFSATIYAVATFDDGSTQEMTLVL